MTAVPINRTVLALGVAASVCFVGLAVGVGVGSPSLTRGMAVIIFLTVCVWVFFSERYTLTLTLLTLYLGLADGYLKLRTGSEYATLARDVLLYSICLGLLGRAAVRRQEMHLAPYAGVLMSYLLLVVVQLAHPNSGGLGHSLASLRPHIEFLPLFFLGYLAVRTKSQLRGLLVVLVVIGAANGLVSYAQFGLSTEQLAAWGPGYADRIEGTDEFSGRTFVDDEGDVRVRPFGLAADSGQGGLVALLALPAAIALVSIARGRWIWIASLLGFAVALGIVTSQGRTVMIGAVVTVMAYAALTVVARRLVPTLVGIALFGVALVAATSLSASSAGSSAFDRVEQIAPSRFVDSASEQRGSSIGLAPSYAAQYPFGAGLGRVGPAAAAVGTDRERSLDGETEFNFLVLELGVIGACLFLGLLGALIVRAFRRLRTISDPDVRASVAALSAPLVGMVVMFFASVITAGSPGAPYFWGIAGVLAYWLRPDGHAFETAARRGPP